MKKIFIPFVIMYSLMCYSQSSIEISSIQVPDNNISYPYVNGNTSTIELINNSLRDYVCTAFNIENCELISNCLQVAVESGLDSLSYNSFESDSTISFILYVSKYVRNSSFTWEEYMTFSRVTGERLIISDLFPKNCVLESDRLLLDIQLRELITIRGGVIRQYSQNTITDHEYSVLMFYIDHYVMSLPRYEFLLYDDQIIVQLGIYLPKELKHLIPAFLRIQYSDILSNIDCE